MAFDPVSFIESAYAWEADEHAWSAGLAEAARTLVPRNLGAYAITYDASDVARCVFGRLVVSGIDNQKAVRLLEVDIPRAYQSDPTSVEAVFRRTWYGRARHLPLGDGVSWRPASATSSGSTA